MDQFRLTTNRFPNEKIGAGCLNSRRIRPPRTSASSTVAFFHTSIALRGASGRGRHRASRVLMMMMMIALPETPERGQRTLHRSSCKKHRRGTAHQQTYTSRANWFPLTGIRRPLAKDVVRSFHRSRSQAISRHSCRSLFILRDTGTGVLPGRPRPRQQAQRTPTGRQSRLPLAVFESSHDIRGRIKREASEMTGPGPISSRNQQVPKKRKLAPAA